LNDTQRAGLLWAWRLDGKGGGNALSAGFAVGKRTGELQWIHLDAASVAAPSCIADWDELPAAVTDTLGAAETRPRAVSLSEGLLLVLRGINLNPGQDPEDMVSVRIWLEPGRIITSTRRRLFSMRDVHDAVAAGTGPADGGEFIVMLVDRLADRISHFVDTLESRIDELEEQVDDAAQAVSITSLSMQRRRVAGVRRYLAPQWDALDRLYRDSAALFTTSESQRMRESADRMTRLLEDLDLARERATVLQEELMTRLANEQNARVYLLSVVAAIFLPLSFLTGLLGMNVAGLPGTTDPAAFVYSTLLMAGVGVGLVVWFRARRWI